MTHLRNAAWVMEHCLPGYLDDPDPAVRGWIAEQTTGAAGKIRMLAGYIGLPREGAWDQLVSDLQHSAKMIVMGDFGSVQSERPSLSSQSRIRRHLFADIAFVALALVLLIGLVGVLIILRDRTMVDVAETTAVTTSVALLAGVLIKPLQGRVGGRQSSQDETLNQ